MKYRLRFEIIFFGNFFEFNNFFLSSRLEEIIKQKKKQVAAGKETLQELAMSKEYHQQFLSLEQTKDDLMGRLETYASNEEESKTTLKESKKEFYDLEKFMKNTIKKKNELEQIKIALEAKCKEQQRHYDGLESEMSEPMEELVEARENFNKRALERTKKRVQLQQDIDVKKKKLKSIDQRLTGLNTSRGEYQGAVQRSAQHIKEHTALRDRTINEYDLPPVADHGSSSSSSSSSSSNSNSNSMDDGPNGVMVKSFIFLCW